MDKSPKEEKETDSEVVSTRSVLSQKCVECSGLQGCGGAETAVLQQGLRLKNGDSTP